MSKSVSLWAQVVLAVTLFLSPTAGGMAEADEPTESSTDDDLGRATLKGLWQGREALRTGRYRATERTTRDRPGAEPERQEAEWKGEFDVQSGRFRFEYRSKSEPRRNVTYIETKDSIVLYTPATKTQSIHRPERFKRNPWQFVDIHLVGIANLPELSQLHTSDLQSVFGTSTGLQTKVVEPGRTIELTIPQLKGAVQRRITIDVRKSFAPVHMEMRYKPAEAQEWGNPLTVCDVSWEERGGTWVPTSARISNPRAKRPESHEISIEWLSVNDEIAATDFDRQSIDLPKGTMVVDTRNDQAEPILIDR